MARPPKVTAASMRAAQNIKTAAWNAELLRLAVQSVATAQAAKLESQLQLALESPKPRTFVEATQRFESFSEPRDVMGESFGPGQLLDDMRSLLLATITDLFDRPRNFNIEHLLSGDGLGVTTRITWNV